MDRAESMHAEEIEHTCENCGDPITGPPAISAEGDAFCAVCTASLMSTEVERLRKALDDLAWAATEFSEQAYYKVPAIVEEEFVSALDDARRALGATS